MTINELNQLRGLRLEAKDLARRIREIENRSYIASGAGDGMPHGSSDGDKTSNRAIQLADLKDEYQRQLQRINEKEHELSLYIDTVPDTWIRQIMRYRFIDGRSWSQVAMKMGGMNTGDACRMAVTRYLDSGEVVRFVRIDDDNMLP